MPTLKTGSKVCNSDIDKAEVLNEHFHSILSKRKRNITLFDDVSPLEPIPSLFIDACGVLSQLRRLNPNKAHGHDELSPQLLKLVAEELAPALTIIFQVLRPELHSFGQEFSYCYTHLQERSKIRCIKP